MLLLFETPMGYALFNCNDKKIEKIQDLSSYLASESNVKKLIQVEAIHNFKSTSDAFKSISKLMNGKIPKSLSKFLKSTVIDQELQATIGVADKRLAKLLKEEFGLTCKQNTQIDEMMRAIRYQLGSLLEFGDEDNLKMMTLGVAHGLSRYKLKFSAEKVDTMIMQAICLLDDLDKEINNYMMRLREWYGWHFPELSKIVTDNFSYTKTVKAIGQREKTSATDLSGILPDDIEKDVKQAAQISMGTQISDVDEKYIWALCDQIIELADYRTSLQQYLKARMQALAPNLTSVVGEIIGARLISHAGSLVNLAKCPASTVQILGAEKALFKAIRTRHNTPKYGIIYQAQLVSNTPPKLKGKVARALAAKCSLCVRCDALGESQNAEIGDESRTYIEKRIAYLQSGQGLQETKKPNIQKHIGGNNQGGYNQNADFKRKPDFGNEGKFPNKKVKRNSDDE